MGACAEARGITVHVRAFHDDVRPGSLKTLHHVLAMLLASRRYDWVLTPQDGLATLSVGIARRFSLLGGCRHAVLEFLTREEGDSLYDRMKYALLRFSLKKVDRLTCSSRAEVDYYRERLGLRPDQVVFTPLGGDPGWLTPGPSVVEDYVLSAGRTLRDYATLLAAVEGTGVRVILVTSPSCLEGLSVPSNVEVRFDIHPTQLLELTRRARFVVLPLQNTRISCGQRVLLMAMALGKCCVVTRVSAITDYVSDGKDGLTVEPYDVAGVREAIVALWRDRERADSIGRQARVEFESTYSIERYAESILSRLREGDEARP